jgi:hypothetical protein
VRKFRRNPRYGVHWTTLGGESGIQETGVIRATHDLIWFEGATSLAQLKAILEAGGESTGARGTRVGIVVRLTGLLPRIFGGGGVAYRLPAGLRLRGENGRGITWYFNNGARGDVNKVIRFIRQGRSSY